MILCSVHDLQQIPTTLVPHKRSAEENAMMFENMREKMKDVSLKDVLTPVAFLPFGVTSMGCTVCNLNWDL